MIRQSSGRPRRRRSFGGRTPHLVRLRPGAASWIRQDDPTTGPACTDVAWGHSELSTATLIYAAFRNTGVFRGTTLAADLRGGWGRIKPVHIVGNAVHRRTTRIVGLTVDPLHHHAYVATGLEAGTVWRRSLSAAPTDGWTRYDTGLPTNLPVTGIAVAPDRAVYVSTLGRGLWWRRDLR